MVRAHPCGNFQSGFKASHLLQPSPNRFFGVNGKQPKLVHKVLIECKNLKWNWLTGKSRKTNSQMANQIFCFQIKRTLWMAQFMAQFFPDCVIRVRSFCSTISKFFHQSAWRNFFMYTAISKNVVGENDECQLSSGDCTTERKCGYWNKLRWCRLHTVPSFDGESYGFSY